MREKKIAAFFKKLIPGAEVQKTFIQETLK